MKILIRKTIGSNRETWYMLEGNSKETKPTGEFPIGSGYIIAEGSRFYETDTEITWELKSGSWEAVGQVDITMIEKSITKNGVYDPADDNADGYSSVDVDVEINVTTKSITANGTYNAASDEVDGYSSVTVNVASENNAKFVGTPKAFDLKTNVNSIDIPNDVTSIAGSAFSGASNLTKINFPDNGRFETIGNSSFLGCTGLTSIEFPSSLIQIGNSAFSGCTGLTEINLPDNVRQIGYTAFYNCTGLTSITIPSSMTSIGANAFSGCTNLTQITINKAEGSISGAPWGAPNATVTWTG